MIAVAIVFALAIIVVIMTMLLRRQLREKYGVLWLVIGLLVLILGLFPNLLTSLAHLVGVQLPSNLLFGLTLLLLLGVALHLSWELSRSEDEARRLAEEVGILRADMEALRVSVLALTKGGSHHQALPDTGSVDDGDDGDDPSSTRDPD